MNFCCKNDPPIHPVYFLIQIPGFLTIYSFDYICHDLLLSHDFSRFTEKHKKEIQVYIMQKKLIFQA